MWLKPKLSETWRGKGWNFQAYGIRSSDFTELSLWASRDRLRAEEWSLKQHEMLLCAQGSKSSEQETQEPSLKMSSSHFCLFYKQVSYFFFSLGRRKKKKSIYFPRQPGFDPVTYLWLSSAAKRPHRISNWSFTEAKKHGVHVGSCFAQMPSGGISCDTPIQWSCSPTVRTWSHQQKKDLRGYLDVNLIRIAYKTQPMFPWTGPRDTGPNIITSYKLDLARRKACRKQKIKVIVIK